MKNLKFFAATLVAALAFAAGCAHEQYFSDGKKPEIVISRDRRIYYHDKMTTLGDLPKRLEKSGFPKDRTLPIRMENLHDLKAANDVLVYLRIKGWTRAVLVTERHADSEALGGDAPGISPAQGVISAPAPAPAPATRTAPRRRAQPARQPTRQPVRRR